MKLATLLLTTILGQSAFAMHAPIPREQLLNQDPVEKTRMTVDACVSNKLECQKLQEKKGASSYVTVADVEECVATHDGDEETIGCYLKD